MRNIRLHKIKSFLISRPAIRFTRLFFYNKILPYLKYSFYLLSALLVIAALYMVFFRKYQLEQIKNRFTNYSYRIFNSGSGYTKIRISGNNRTSYEKVAQLARDEILKKDGFDNQSVIQSLKKKIENLPWVDEVIISFSLQDILNIHITEHQPFAIWEDDKKYIISKTGRIIAVDDLSSFESLMILTGNDAYKNVRSLFNILSINPQISANIYSATWVGGRRWDLRFENGLLVKLPSNNNENDMSYAWDSLIKIYNTSGALIGLKTIDLRIAEKIYLEYDEETSKGFKNYHP